MKNERFHNLLKEIGKLHDRKNQDYGAEQDPLANFKMCQNIGVSPFKGCCIRISDKYSRLCSFLRKGYLAVEDEKITDTLMDMAVYSLIAILLKHEEEEKRETQTHKMP